ncbi:Retrotransposon-derived protein PEG10 AltName: Full=Embryonal carcinoma differentiation regulated protein [Rhizoctonia solani AG-1 IB]|uniref:Rhizoctonia solani AG1-IB WGS project CAOJ00000000 data, isolate 7/3/14, contig 19671 n=1 Tax=Thanatephorus cucumeris (strain AG1-IB / isolate 7/3/14) TaxID=1108050 RepID=M5CFN8_THACB|nr:Retrotransposon-derived protein PEG10 AltName: Full=Embryonal carcinoma differentiation regulated protein [Rhizoctonia solani AG-1 IB]
MATPSRPTSALGQHLDQRIPTPAGTTSHQGPATLDEIRDLLLFFGDAISELTRRISENEEVTKEVRTTVENISQQVDNIAIKVNEPRTPEQAHPIQPVDETPRATTSAAGKKVTIAPTDPIRPWYRVHTPATDDGGFSLFDAPDVKPLIPTPAPRAPSLGASTIPVGPPGRSPSRTPGGTLKPIKVKAPEPFKGGSGTEAKQWLARMNGWLRLSATQFNSEEDIVTFLLVNMEGSASAWALPHLANMGSNKATITTAMEFDTAFSRAFFDPDEQRAAERKITNLVQTTTTAAYATEFRTLLMSLDWNDAALRAQFYKGLHWQVKQQLAQKETQPQDLEELVSAATRIDNVRRELEISRPPRENRSKPAATTTATTSRTNHGTPRVNSERLKADPNYVSEAERQRRRDEKLCIKCGKAGHRFAECRTGWKGPDKGKETAKIAETESEKE